MTCRSCGQSCFCFHYGFFAMCVENLLEQEGMSIDEAHELAKEILTIATNNRRGQYDCLPDHIKETDHYKEMTQ